MPIRVYRLKRMPDGREHYVTREEYRYTFLHDFILQGRVSEQTVDALERWLGGNDIATIFLGKQFSGRMVEIPTADEMLALFPDETEERLELLRKLEANPGQYLAYVF